MAPIEPSATAQAESGIRDTIQSLYNVMLHISAYDASGPNTTLDALFNEVHVLLKALQNVSEVASNGDPAVHGGPDSKTTLPAVPGELVDYVEAGRNPDIYTREFVELVRRTNQLRAGKAAAFRSFRDVLAEQVRIALPELAADVDRVVQATSPGGSADGQHPGHPAQGIHAESEGGGQTRTGAAAGADASHREEETAAAAQIAASAATAADSASPARQGTTDSVSVSPQLASLLVTPSNATPAVDLLDLLPVTPQPPEEGSLNAVQE